MIKTGQFYRSVSNRHHPVDGPALIKVVKCSAGFHLNWYENGRVTVVTVTKDGREVRQRRINSNQLHESAVTKDGQPRRTGYVLVP